MATPSLELLCVELRDFIKTSVLESGGHFSSNLGVIELTVALHHTLDLSNDAIIWDVGHQSYPHKVLTGRKDQLKNIRNFKGISGFPKIEENPLDSFGTGHSSTAISAAMGMAAAQKIISQANATEDNVGKTHAHLGNQESKPLLSKNPEPTFVAVIGDGALTAGLSYEALNNLFESHLNVLVILNDNHMGIDPNTGALNTQLQTNAIAVKHWFEWFGLDYSGPVDGHNLQALLIALQQAYHKSGPRILHIKTIKGKGHLPAEQEQTKWHSASKYVKIENSSTPQKKWQDVFGEIVVALAKTNPTLAGITPAMPSSCGMIHAMNQFPDRFFDVGIAEQHALTFAAGMATKGLTPIVNIYSSFLQRGYDQLIHDIVLQKLPVILCIDRAGLVGEDGPTHHGAFDIAFLNCIPNLEIIAPKNAQELAHAIQLGLVNKKPIAIRYPKGNVLEPLWELSDFISSKQILQPQILHDHSLAEILLLSTGHASNLCEIAYQKPLDVAFQHIHWPVISDSAMNQTRIPWQQFKYIVTVEDGCIQGGWGKNIVEQLREKFNFQSTHLGIPHDFIEHGNNEEDLYPLCGYSPTQIAQALINSAASLTQ